MPDSWVALDLTSMSVQQAMARVQLKGPTVSAMRSAVEQLKTSGGLIVVDTASVASSPFKFATNVNAFCTPSSIVPGPGAASSIIAQTEYSYPEAHGQVISDRKIVSTSKAVVVRVEANLPTKAGLTVHELQFITLASRRLLCYTTFSTDRPAQYSPQFLKIADSIHFG